MPSPLPLTLLLALAPALALPAAAMNWEGHDESLKDVPGIEAFASGVRHRPLPSPPCPVSWDEVKANPYEQIPLAGRACAPPAGKAPARPHGLADPSPAR